MVEPSFTRGLSSVTELLQRETDPKELELCEVTPEGELVYVEQVSRSLHKKSPFAYASPNVIIDKRCLERNQFTYRKYVFNKDSIFMNWLSIREHTRMMVLFRRLNTCRHRFSCAESILRRFYKWVSGYIMVRVPLYYMFASLFYAGASDPSHFMANRKFLIAEAVLLGFSGVLYAGFACFIRYLNEEIVEGGVGGAPQRDLFMSR